MPTRLLIADDHQLFREGLKALLPPAEFEVVAEAADGQEAIRLGRRVQPDLALLDITMPGLNGVDAARELLRVSPGSRVVVLTMHKDNAYLVEALRAGVRGYVLKSQPTAELLHALREVARGEVYLAPGFWRTLVESYHNGEDMVLDPLSPREREVLQLVAERGVTDVCFHVRDDGRGFVPRVVPSAAAGSCFCLDGIRERLAPFGGALEVSSQPGHGTALLIRIPLDGSHARSSSHR